MFTTLRNAWKIPELRKKILFTLFVLLIYRLGSCVPVPYINVDVLNNYYTQQLSNTVLGLYNAMSGSAFSNATVFALGIQPYINASIIIELLCIAIPALERLAKDEGEEGKKKIQKITRYTTVGLSLLMGIAYYIMLKNASAQYSILEQTSFVSGMVIVMTFMAGAAFLMWVGEQIDQFGIGNGISMILFAGIVSRVPSMVSSLFSLKWYVAILMVVGMLAIVMFIVFISNSERRIPVQYAKRVVGRKMYGGQSTHIPLKVNSSGVLPLIFASALMQFPPTILAMFGSSWWDQHINVMGFWYQLVFALLIIGFTFFYSSISFNPDEIAKNMQQNGGSIPGIRQGKPTALFIAKITKRINLFGALFLAVLATIPTLIYGIANVSLPFQASSLLIAVSVALETTRQLESQILMRHYKGFLK